MDRLSQRKQGSHIHYGKWAYIFLVPFILAFFLFQFIPLFQTLYYSFFTYYDDMLSPTVGPTWSGLDNFKYIFTSSTLRPISFLGLSFGSVKFPDFWYYLINTILIWLIGFIPQILISLQLAIWFTDIKLNLKFQKIWKTVIYMPNLIMAAAFGMLFLMIFARNGPVMATLVDWKWLTNPIDVGNTQIGTRLIIAFLDFLMWFGNTTILLMAGVMGIDNSIFESALLDGASSRTIFHKITMPLLKPIFIYVVITSMIGGIQLFDVAQIFTQQTGGPSASSYTLMMWLYNLISNKENYGEAGALSFVMFVITAVLSVTVYKIIHPRINPAKDEALSRKKRIREYKDSPFTQAELANKTSLSENGVK
jgi:multiple sugar transport system permease protein